MNSFTKNSKLKKKKKGFFFLGGGGGESKFIIIKINIFLVGEGARVSDFFSQRLQI